MTSQRLVSDQKAVLRCSSQLTRSENDLVKIARFPSGGTFLFFFLETLSSALPSVSCSGSLLGGPLGSLGSPSSVSPWRPVVAIAGLHLKFEGSHLIEAHSSEAIFRPQSVTSKVFLGNSWGSPWDCRESSGGLFKQLSCAS